VLCRDTSEPERPLPDQAVCGKRMLIRRRPLWWCAIDPDEILGMIETNTVYRAWTRDRLIAKLRKRFAPKPKLEWEEINL
jgi:hypothetical protein